MCAFTRARSAGAHLGIAVVLLVTAAAGPSFLVAQHLAAPRWEGPLPPPSLFVHGEPLASVAVLTAPSASLVRSPTTDAGSGGTSTSIAGAAVYGGMLTLGLGFQGLVLGGAVGTVHETACFGDTRAAASAAGRGGLVLGLSAIPVLAAFGAFEPKPAMPGRVPALARRRPLGERLVRDAVLQGLIGASIGAAGGALEATRNDACGGSLRAAGQGALLLGAAGVAVSPLWTLLQGS
jgi:hypothetical protein